MYRVNWHPVEIITNLNALGFKIKHFTLYPDNLQLSRECTCPIKSLKKCQNTEYRWNTLNFLQK